MWVLFDWTGLCCDRPQIHNFMVGGLKTCVCVYVYGLCVCMVCVYGVCVCLWFVCMSGLCVYIYGLCISMVCALVFS